MIRQMIKRKTIKAKTHTTILPPLRLLAILTLSILTTSAVAVTIMPEIRKTVTVSKTDITRISCEHGKIGSINYAAGTGLTHKKHENGKNVILLFQQLVNNDKRKLIDAKVNFLISCNNEYYPLILDPQMLNYQQTIRLDLPEQEIAAQRTMKDFNHKTREQVLLELIKRSRNSATDIQHNNIGNTQTQSNNSNTQIQSNNGNTQTSHNNIGIQTQNNSNIQTHNNNALNAPNMNTQAKAIYLGDLQLKLVNQFDVIGSTFQVKKFVVISNKTAKTFTEKMFISTSLGKFQIAALSLDNYNLAADKNWTYLHVVLDRGALR